MRIQRTTRIALAIVAVAAIAASACSDGGSTGPTEQPGQLTVSVTSSGASGAAYLITVTGTGITNATAASAGHQLYSVLAGNTLTAAIILQSAADGDILVFSVPDVNAASSYDVDLVQVAGADNALLSTSSFTLDVE